MMNQIIAGTNGFSGVLLGMYMKENDGIYTAEINYMISMDADAKEHIGVIKGIAKEHNEIYVLLKEENKLLNKYIKKDGSRCAFISCMIDDGYKVEALSINHYERKSERSVFREYKI